MSKIAVVTGASKGIGEAIAKKLITLGYRVIGVSRTPPAWDNEQFSFVPCDLGDELQTQQTAHMIAQTYEIDLFVANAGKGIFCQCDEMKEDAMISLTKLNFLAPMMLTKIFLPSLKRRQGQIIAISSMTAYKTSPLGGVYAATKAGLSHFFANLFEEVRKYDVGVSVIAPDMTDTPFYDNLSFGVGDDERSYVTPECIVDGVELILKSRKGSVITTLMIKPQIVKITKKGRKG